MKYKLIKTYPGSQELGTIVSSENKTSDWKGSNYYEKYPEFWEKVNDNLWWCVWENDYIQDNRVYFKSWTPYQIECVQLPDLLRHYFKTKEDAEDFILYNKPCLNLKTLSEEMGVYFTECPSFFRLINLVKSKL